MTAPATTAWAIKAPEGVIYPNSIDRTRSECIERFTSNEPYTWPAHEKFGYRCVKVQITEMEEGK